MPENITASKNKELPNNLDESFLEEKKRLQQGIEKILKKSSKRVSSRQEILKECKNWKQVHHKGLLIQSNLYRLKKGEKSFIVADWENNEQETTINLDPLISPKEQAEAYFRKSKKLQKGEKHAERLLKVAEEELSLLLQQKQVLDKVAQSEELKTFISHYRFSTHTKKDHTSKKTEKTSLSSTKPFKIFFSQAGKEIWVGKNAKDNDLMTFKYANKSDFWLHAHNYPGSHVVLRTLKDEEPDHESIQDAAELAIRFSKCKNHNEGEVCFARINSLCQIKKTPGKVLLSKHKVLKIFLNNERWERLKLSKPT